MIWVPLAGVALVLLVVPTILAIGAWVRAKDAQEQLEIYERRIAELERRAGIERRKPAAAAAVAAEPGVEPGVALEERIALVWFSRIGAAVVLLGAVWFLFSPSDTATGRLSRVAVGVLAGLATLAVVEVGRERTRSLYNHALLAMGVALLVAAAIAARVFGLAGTAAAFAAFAAVAAVGAGLAVRHRSQPPLVLALVAVGVAPVLLRTAGDSRIALGWAAALLAGGTAVAAYLAQPWAAALGLALGTALFAAWGALGYGTTAAAVGFAAVVWLLLVAAWIAAARLARRQAPDAVWPLALLVATLALGHVPPAVYFGASPALLAAIYGALALAGAVTLRREGEPTLLAVPLAIASAALFGPSVQRAAGTRGLTTLALAAWCAVHQGALLRAVPGKHIPTRFAAWVAAAAGAAFLVIDGGVLAPHVPRWFAIVLAVFAVTQIAAARAASAPAVAAVAAFFSTGGLVGASAHAHGSRDAVFVAAALAWSLALIAAPVERILRRARPWRTELAASAAAAVTLAVVGWYAVPPESPLLRALVLAIPSAAPLGLGIALRGSAPRAAPALLSLGLAMLGATVGVTAGGAAATVVWAVGATALVASGFRMHSALSRRLGLGVFVAAIGKLAVWDVWRLSRPYQIGVFLVVGALLLVASRLYAGRGAPAKGAAAPAGPGAVEAHAPAPSRLRPSG